MRSRLTCSKPASRAHRAQRAGPPGLVHPVQDGQHVRRRALHAQGDPGEPGRAQGGQGCGVHALRVGLDGDLGAGREAEFALDDPQDLAELPGREQSRGAAAEEHGGHRARRGAQHPAGQPDLRGSQRRVGVPRHPRPELGGGVGVEVAVPAAALAERHVHVEPERAPTQLGGGAGRQCAVSGDGRAGREDSGHGQPAAGPRRAAGSRGWARRSTEAAASCHWGSSPGAAISRRMSSASP